MKALLVREHGGIGALELGVAPDPVPGAGEVLVDVRATSINFPDLLVIGGTYQKLPPRPFSPGKDLAGVVAAVGDGVTTCKPGDRVSAQIEYGAYAEKCVVRAANCHVMPASMSYADAAAMGLTYLTAHFSLIERARYQPGEVVLVNGAAGGVGLAACNSRKHWVPQ
ncbi:MAG TPA: alcohol dehydrogenase catalytic domain-containing protein [Burkholderiales bacterium]|nr:alcohol dehydrogenase catalytic domain-containing protein [Burkholderiales bacterium]